MANARYWTSVAPLLRAELSRWESRARAIPDPLLRALATGKLGEERFNIEVAATLATLAPRARRGLVVEAVVALQAAYDYLDVLTERPAAEALSADPVEGGRRLQRALIDAVTSSSRTAEGSRCGSERDYYRGLSHTRDGGYLRQLVTTVSGALAQLPAADTVAEIARGSAERCAQAQVLAHACAHSGEEELERWARGQAAGSGLRWPEWLVGAQSSVLALHALIAAAADDHTTREDAERIDRVYLSIGALTLLDSLVDRERDLAAGERCYMHRYGSPGQLARALAGAAHGAARDAGALPHADHHTMTLVGVVAYYASAPAARDPRVRPVFKQVCAQLRPLIGPTLATMLLWRLAKRVAWVSRRVASGRNA